MSRYVPFQGFWDFLRNKNDDEIEDSFDETYGDPDRDVSDGTKRGLILILMALVFMFLLVLFRYCCFWIIDSLIMCEHRRHNQSFLRYHLSKCFPCWFTPPPPRQHDSSQVADDDSHSSEERETELVERNTSYAKRIVRKLTEEEKRSIFSTILTSRKATSADITERPMEKDTNQQSLDGSVSDDSAATSTAASSSITVTDGSPLPTDLEGENNHACCPICIQDIKVNDEVYHCNDCQHLFHFDCMLGWVGTGSTLCPYCRREIVSRTMLKRAYKEHKAENNSQDDAV